MGSYTGTPEIVEVKEELDTVRRYRSYSTLGTRSALDDELSNLFESISRRSSSRGSASSTHRDSVSGKRPVSASVPQSPRISGEPVSIKQALRDLCLSKASEMAAIKRSNKQCSSPVAPEAGRIKTLYEAVANEKQEEQEEETKAKTAHIVKKLASLTSQSSPKTSAQSSPKTSAQSSPRYGGCPPSQKPPPSKITLPNPNPKFPLPKPQNPRETHKETPIQSSSGSRDMSIEIPKKPKRGTKLGGKSKLRGVHVNRIAKVNTHSRVSKPPLKRAGKNGTIKSNPAASTKTHLVCQNCQCAIKEDARGISDPNPSKPKQNCELSLTSKSSLGEFSTSTSNSEESTLSRPSCGHKPHMSKDIRWEVIRRAKQRDGILTLKHFNLLKKLGCGDIGTVYLAELVGSSCLFAIKVMDNEFLARRKKMSRAHMEREILRTLDHPFLPTLYTQFTSDNLSCLVMEFCPGGDLHVLRQKQPGRCFPEPAARFYVAEVLLALEYLHMLGIIYRDLKPENILVRDDGHIMLTDFDLSLTCNVKPTLLEASIPDSDPSRVSGPCAESNCIDPFCMKPTSCFTPKMHVKKVKEERVSSLQLVAEPSDARSNSFVGTHEYLAPEIIKGEGHGAAVDWWTLGVFLYELLYGRTPFKGCGNEETLANVVVEGLTFPDAPLVSVKARDLIRRLLAKEPEGRLGAAKGAAEIKTHPFFEGQNWALIRCAVPPETPVRSAPFGKNNKLMECKTTGDHLEFDLF